MNERLKELALQAGYTKDVFGIGHWDMPECKKFADLVDAAARADERMKCEMAIEELPPDADRSDCAAAIRARSNT